MNQSIGSRLHRMTGIVAELTRTVRGRGTAEVARVRLRALDLPRRRRSDANPDRAFPDWNGQTLIIGLPILTYGQQRLYRVEPC